jgi:hypothetical protein
VILLSLVGEQPIPNVLVPRALKPQVCVWAHTDRTAPIADRLRKLLDPLPSALLNVPPYDLAAIEAALELWMADHRSNTSIVCNLTGGTKPMAWAAERVAARHSLPIVYLQTEGRTVKLLHYQPDGEALRLTETRNLPRLINIKDYLRAHGLWEWLVKSGERSPFETLVEKVLKRACDEVQANFDFNAFEVDFLLRRGNHVGVAECKSGRWKQTNSKRAGIDQLVIASDNKYLGTYTERFLLSDGPISDNLMRLAEARQVHVVILASAVRTEYRRLSAADETHLIEMVQTQLGK